MPYQSTKQLWKNENGDVYQIIITNRTDTTYTENISYKSKGIVDEVTKVDKGVLTKTKYFYDDAKRIESILTMNKDGDVISETNYRYLDEDTYWIESYVDCILKQKEKVVINKSGSIIEKIIIEPKLNRKRIYLTRMIK